MQNLRIQKGKEIASLNQINEIQERVYLVPSQTNGERYKVLHHYKFWSCGCPDYKYRQVKCKHIYGVKYWLDLKNSVKKTQQFKGLQNAQTSCVYCSSLNVVKNGARKNLFTKKQRFKCKECNKFFVLNQEFARLKADEKAVTLAIDLYFKGLSLKKIQDTLKQFYGVKVHYSTVFRWIEKFMALINDYVSKMQPKKFSYIIHTDETKIKTKKDDWIWCWNSMDTDTKFLLASTISKGRYLKDAKNHFKEVKAVCPDKPAYVFTDGLPAYKKGVKRIFNPTHGAQKLFFETKHISNVGIRDKKSNNKIERLHGSQKERLKVMRGVNHKKALKSKMKSWKTYYNFVRPHEGLQGKTPAEASGITPAPQNNKWLSLIKQSKIGD